jgi:hypothetical protein
MSGESVCQVARSWVDVGSFHTRLVVRFVIFTASVRNILDKSSYSRKTYHCHHTDRPGILGGMDLLIWLTIGSCVHLTMVVCPQVTYKL